MVGARELVLCLAGPLADRRYIDRRRYPCATRFPVSMSGSVTEASCNLVESTLNCFFLRPSVSVLVKMARHLAYPS
jgi:hypothetical protein